MTIFHFFFFVCFVSRWRRASRVLSPNPERSFPPLPHGDRVLITHSSTAPSPHRECCFFFKKAGTPQTPTQPGVGGWAAGAGGPETRPHAGTATVTSGRSELGCGTGFDVRPVPSPVPRPPPTPRRCAPAAAPARILPAPFLSGRRLGGPPAAASPGPGIGGAASGAPAAAGADSKFAALATARLRRGGGVGRRRLAPSVRVRPPVRPSTARPRLLPQDAPPGAACGAGKTRSSGGGGRLPPPGAPVGRPLLRGRLAQPTAAARRAPLATHRLEPERPSWRSQRAPRVPPDTSSLHRAGMRRDRRVPATSAETRGHAPVPRGPALVTPRRKEAPPSSRRPAPAPPPPREAPPPAS